MSRKRKGLLAGGLVITALIVLALALSHSSIPLLQPAGPVAQKERNLIIVAFLLSMIVVVPVYVMLIVFSLKYRQGNKTARYDPGFSHSRWLESAWWGVPLVIISILAVITWNSSHDLDPFKKLDSSKPALKIQVVSLRWKWLFLYPSEGVATVNYVNFPVNTPVDFEITSDAPMNSFWIPQLGGQIYAMSGMSTSLNLMADKLGTYRGLSANISGDGFAGMHFSAIASTQQNYQKWLAFARNNQPIFDSSVYDKLSAPSSNNPPAYYALADPSLYNQIINKYAEPVFRTDN